MLCPLLFNCPPIDHFMNYTILKVQGRFVKVPNKPLPATLHAMLDKSTNRGKWKGKNKI
jgi:hypothetical protein